MQNIEDIKSLIRRRHRIFIISSIPVLILVIIITFILPPIYVSRSTILIESQDIPPEYVKTTITGYVEQRLQTITQQILSSEQLTDIINKFNLYDEMRKKYDMNFAINKMRKDIALNPIQTTTGRSNSTIAFTIEYEGKDPETVQQVTEVLASLYLKENVRKREEQASRTTKFLQKELDQIKKQIDDYANKITLFKQAHLGELPEYYGINARALEQLKRDLEQADLQTRSLEERKTYLEGQRESIITAGPSKFGSNGKTIMSPRERLNFLRLQLITLQSRLSDKHPDIVNTKREIKDLEKKVKQSLDNDQIQQKINVLRHQIANMESRLGPQHPDVLKVKNEITYLTKELGKTEPDAGSSVSDYRDIDNPAYANIKMQIDKIDLEIKHIIDAKKLINEKMNVYQKRIENTPLVEKEYDSLVTDYRNAKQKYNDIMNKLLEANVAKGMEETQHGERFTIIEPANKPTSPEKPNRKKMLLLAFFLAFSVGGGLSFLQENFDHSIKTARELTDTIQIPVLSTIPNMITEEEAKRKRKKTIIVSVLTVLFICLTVISIHLFFMPLDSLFLKIQQKLMTFE